jgi:hypothetical protein
MDDVCGMVEPLSVDIRWIELCVGFVVLPIVFAIAVHRFNYRGAMAPVLWLISLALTAVLFRDHTFERAALWSWPHDNGYVASVLLRFGVLGTGLMVLGRVLTPGGFLWLPRKQPVFWLGLVLAYPALSAIPQGLIWRVFFAHRYAPLLGHGPWLITTGAAAFALAHLAFWNRTAIVVTAIGGALFLNTYLSTQSMLLAAAEHGAYGLVAFTAGLGPFLYRGARVAHAAKPEAAPDLRGAANQ